MQHFCIILLLMTISTEERATCPHKNYVILPNMYIPAKNQKQEDMLTGYNSTISLQLFVRHWKSSMIWSTNLTLI